MFKLPSTATIKTEQVTQQPSSILSQNSRQKEEYLVLPSQVPPFEVPIGLISPVDNMNEMYQSTLSAQNSVMYVWGSDSHGQLGLSTDKKGSFVKKPKKCTWNIAVRSMSCGVNHVAIVTQEGQVYTVGSNSYGKLGIASSNGSPAPFSVQSPTLIEELLHCNIVQVSCGVEFTLALTNSGIVYAWGQNLNNSLGIQSESGLTEVQIDRPRQVKLLSQHRITQISAGDKHQLFLTDQGTVFAMGNNTFGQLGVKSTAQFIFTPQQVMFDARIKEISAGKKHSLFLTEEGKVWSAGQQFPATTDSSLSCLKLSNIEKIKCHNYSLALSETGDLFVWGGQVTSPAKVSQIPGKVASIEVGRSHIAAIDQDGILWVWGGNKKGELGLGDQVSRWSPYPLISLKGKQVQSVCIGKKFTIAFSRLTSENDNKSSNQMTKTNPFSKALTQTSRSGLTGTITHDYQSKAQSSDISLLVEQANKVAMQQIMKAQVEMNKSRSSKHDKVLVQTIKEQTKVMQQLQAEVLNRAEEVTKLTESLEKEKGKNCGLINGNAQYDAANRGLQRAAQKNETLQHELNHGREYVEDMQRQNEILQDEVREKDRLISDHFKTVQRLGEQVKTQNLQIGALQAQAQVDGVQSHQQELIMEIDHAKLLLNQKVIEGEKYEQVIENLNEKVNACEFVNSQTGITNHQLQRKIINLEHELSLQISANDQTKMDLERLDGEVTDQTKLGSQREKLLGLRLEEVNKVLRDERNSHLETQMKLRDVATAFEEVKIDLRQERNSLKLLGLENNYVVDQAADERWKSYNIKKKRVFSEAAMKDRRRNKNQKLYSMPKDITKDDTMGPPSSSIFGNTRIDSTETPSLLNLAHAPESLISRNKFLTIINENGTLSEQKPSQELEIQIEDQNSEYLEDFERAEDYILQTKGDERGSIHDTSYFTMQSQKPFVRESSVDSRTPPKSESVSKASDLKILKQQQLQIRAQSRKALHEGTQSTQDILYQQKPFSSPIDAGPLINKSFLFQPRPETVLQTSIPMRIDPSRETTEFKKSTTLVADDHSQITSNYKSFKERISLKKTDRSNSKSGTTKSRGRE